MTGMLDVLDPYTGELAGQVELKTADELKEMVDRAAEAQVEWENTPLHERGDVLNKLADLLLANADEIARLCTLEMGKPIAQAYVDIEDAASLLKGCVQRAKHLYGDVLADNVPGMENDLWFTKREAVGVVGGILPFNYPIEQTFQKMAPALTMGNACIAKAPSSNPLAILSVAKYFEEAGLPGGVAQLYVAGHAAVTEAILENPAVQAIGMTGSSATGVQLMKNGATTMKRLFLELGGNDPLIIFDDVDPDDAVAEIMGGRQDNNGQTCCASKRFIIQKGIEDVVIKKLVAGIKAWKTGNPFDEDTVVSCLVTEAAAEEVEKQVADTVALGAKLLYGGKRESARWEPAVLTEVTKDMPIAGDMEVFAMVFPVIAFDTEEEAVSIANSTQYGLSSGVMSADMKRAFRVARQIKAGACVINGHGCYRHYDQPFGGPKMSGIGREGVSTTLEEYSVVKTYVYKGAFGEDA